MCLWLHFNVHEHNSVVHGGSFLLLLSWLQIYAQKNWVVMYDSESAAVTVSYFLYVVSKNGRNFGCLGVVWNSIVRAEAVDHYQHHNNKLFRLLVYSVCLVNINRKTMEPPVRTPLKGDVTSNQEYHVLAWLSRERSLLLKWGHTFWFKALS